MASHYFNEDTIVAPATPLHAVGAIGIVRVSGPAALESASRIIRPRKRALADGAAERLRPENLESHKLYRCEFFDAANRMIDDGMFVWMRGPNSYTGEDSVELQMHGNPYILTRTVEALVASGQVRAAEPGEFSFRAFRNGKLDLAQAEAVGDLIAAKSDAAMRLALSALNGSARKAVEGIQEGLIAMLAAVELDIDFSEQDVPQVNPVALLQKVDASIAKIEACRERFRRSRPLREGIRTAIVGAPNSGKSTLFNQLLGEDRSIVSEIAGTTRDVVRESILFKGLLLVLSDTAGIRDAQDAIEREGIARSFVEVKDAHLVLALVDASEPEQARRAYAEKLRTEVESRNPGAKLVVILNKRDKVAPNAWADALADLEKFLPVGLSARTGEGLADLHVKILERFGNLEMEDEAGGITRARHDDILARAQEHLRNLRVRIARGDSSPDLLSLDLRAAVDTVAEISGRFTSDDLLNFIFSKFCIGK